MTGFLDAGGGGGGGSPPEADGPDDPRSGSTPPDDDRQEVEGEPGPDPDLADGETDRSALDSIERTLDQLRGGGGAAVDRDSIRLDSSDIPVAPGQWPLGFPIQGLPRAAVTFNLNYVYDEEKGQWVRDTGNRNSGGGVEIVAEGTLSLGADEFDFVETGVSGPERLVRPVVTATQGANFPFILQFIEEEFRNPSLLISYALAYIPDSDEWAILTSNGLDQPFDLRWALLEFGTG